MKKQSSKYSLKERIQKSKRKKLYYTVSVTMAAIVVFCTVYALILPAITMEKEQKVLDCSLSVHQHTEQCYDSAKNLICGEADFAVHTHSDGDCYDINGNLVCRIPEVVEHNHNNSCYDKKGNLICNLPEVELHKHKDSCYDKDGTLICGKLQTTRHIHGSGCFKTSVSTNDSAPKKIIKPASLTNVSSSSNSGWGYREDHSIYWGGLNATQFAADAIQENTPYVISGWQDNNLMADETYTKGDATYLKAIPKGHMNNYQQYQRWYFEKTNEDGKYYVYFLKTNKNGTDTPFYLQYAGYGVNEWGRKTLQTALTEDKAQATVFTLAKCNNSAHPDHITLSADFDGETFYVNSYFGDKPENDGRTTHWLGYQEYSDGCFLRVSQYYPKEENTANRLETDTSTNSVINLFDYWITPNRTDPDGVNPVPNLLETGINSGHDFKFTKGAPNGSYKLNYWTGRGQLPLQGIVSQNLDSDGYPKLSGNSEINGTTSEESLRYLFDPTVEHEGKASYRNVGGLLKLDEEDYYAYSCNKNMAEFNEDDNNIYLYDKPGVTGSGDKGQFFPFNKAPQVMTSGREDTVMNHYFGMTITTRFIQRHDGYTSNDKNTKTTFHFSGDDDVWIFIDGVLVGDVGGIHDASTVDIDFVTGEVQVAVAGRDTKAPKTTIRDCYRKAGKENSVLWNGNTFENNTTHTLKFYYLERGNSASNLELKFNLTEIPRTAIKKTNEYGDAVVGAKFAVYAAEVDGSNNYHMLDKKGGARVQNLPDDISYDEKGNIVDSSGNILVNALYNGTTDENGEMVFVDQDYMYYTINELNDLFGDNFILREIEVPEGYRMVSNDIYLQVFKGEGQKILKCDNSGDSGARAATNLQITATDTIHLLRNYTGEGEFNGKTAVQYCDPETGKPFGTLFAVVLKYIGPVDGNGNVKVKDMGIDSYWTPVYGNDEQGYKLVDRSDGKSIVAAAIEAAKEGQKYGDVAFSHSTSSSTMKLMMKNLPGHITKYYRMLGEDDKGKTRYTVGYYWTDKSSPDNAISDDVAPENTYGVNSEATTFDDGSQYSGFERVFGAEIQIPNLVNDIYVQKVDSKNTLINGATFAIYQVQQADNGEIRYLAKAADGTTSYVPLPENAKPDKVTGNITAGDKTIKPLKTDVTKDFEDGIHKGSVRFFNFTNGQYIIKEIKAPPGYNLNTSDIMVLVTNETIYANAGTEDDGITVGRGPGYIVSTLDNYASQGEIDNTLTWIYSQMRISGVSDRFADVGNEDKILGYLTENYSSKTGTEAEAARTYLEYSSEKTGTAFNYVPNEARTVESGAQNPLGTRRLFTTVGWPYYEVHQDSSYGREQVKKTGANYEDGNEMSVTNLFSRSTYVRVTDMNDVTLKIKKVDSTNKDVSLSGAQFRLYRLSADNQKEYYVKDSKNNVSWNTDEKTAFVVNTGDNGMSGDGFNKLTDGTFYLEEIKAPTGYSRPSRPVELKIELSKLTLNEPSAFTVDEVLDDESNLYTYTVTVPNSTGYELPATGGSGTIMYTTGGILLIAVSLVCGYRRKRRSERRFK